MLRIPLLKEHWTTAGNTWKHLSSLSYWSHCSWYNVATFFFFFEISISFYYNNLPPLLCIKNDPNQKRNSHPSRMIINSNYHEKWNIINYDKIMLIKTGLNRWLNAKLTTEILFQFIVQLLVNRRVVLDRFSKL